jgi:hypothetical protein
MASLNDEEIWSVLQEQADEDAQFEQMVSEIAALSDDALDDELRRAGYELADIDKKADAFAREATRAPAAAAVEQRAPRRSQRPPPRRPVVLWIAAAATVSVGAGLIYASLTRPPPPPPPQPEPMPSTPPQLAPPPTDVVAARDLRTRAAAALDDGHADECLQLLDVARGLDPAGDMTPDVLRLRKRAIEAKKPR